MEERRDRLRDSFTVAEVAAMIGVPVPTIRSWERRYGVPGPARTLGGHRRYSRDDVARLRALRDDVVRGHRAGDAAQRAVRIVPASPREEVEDMVQAALRLDAKALQRVLDESAATMGVEEALGDVALPGLRELGLRWSSGECDVAHEHVATESVRFWMARMRALAPDPFRPGTLVLAAAPLDAHTVGLEAFALVLARRGWDCRMTGGQTPQSSLLLAARQTDATGVVVSCQLTQARRSAIEALRALARLRGPALAYAGAVFTAAEMRRGVPGRYLGEDLLVAAEMLDEAAAA